MNDARRRRVPDGMLDPGRIAELAARAAHGTQNLYNLAVGDAPLPVWDDLSTYAQANVVNGAAAVLRGITPEESHRLWAEALVAEGWTYGPEKDFDAGRHPCLVPYEKLPEATRRRDALFMAVVRAFAEAVR